MKKSIIKIVSTIVLFIVMVITMRTVTYAENNTYSATISLTSDSKLNQGETVVVNVSISNIVAGEGIDALTAKINYDTNIFEELTTDSIKSTTNWVPTYAPASGKMSALKNARITSNETMFTITLKVKQTATATSTVITLSDIVLSGGIVANGGTGDIVVPNATVAINKVEAIAMVSPTPTAIPTVAINATGKPTPVTNVKNANMPKAGVEDYLPLTLAVIAIIVAIQVIGNKMNKK